MVVSRTRRRVRFLPPQPRSSSSPITSVSPTSIPWLNGKSGTYGVLQHLRQSQIIIVPSTARGWRPMHRRPRRRLIGARKCVLGVGSYHGLARCDVSPYTPLYPCITYINIVIHRRPHAQLSRYLPLPLSHAVCRRCALLSGPPYGMALGSGKRCTAAWSPLSWESSSNDFDFSRRA